MAAVVARSLPTPTSSLLLAGLFSTCSLKHVLKHGSLLQIVTARHRSVWAAMSRRCLLLHGRAKANLEMESSSPCERLHPASGVTTGSYGNTALCIAPKVIIHCNSRELKLLHLQMYQTASLFLSTLLLLPYGTDHRLYKPCSHLYLTPNVSIMYAITKAALKQK